MNDPSDGRFFAQPPGFLLNAAKRRLADSNRCKRLCRPLPNHSAKAPDVQDGTSARKHSQAQPGELVAAVGGAGGAGFNGCTHLRTLRLGELLDSEGYRAAQLRDELPQLGFVAEAVARRQLLELVHVESGGGEELADPLGRAPFQRVALRTSGARLEVAELDHRVARDGHPRVPLARRPDGEGETAAGPEHTARLGEGARRVALQ